MPRKRDFGLRQDRSREAREEGRKYRLDSAEKAEREARKHAKRVAKDAANRAQVAARREEEAVAAAAAEEARIAGLEKEVVSLKAQLAAAVAQAPPLQSDVPPPSGGGKSVGFSVTKANQVPGGSGT